MLSLSNSAFKRACDVLPLKTEKNVTVLDFILEETQLKLYALRGMPRNATGYFSVSAIECVLSLETWLYIV